MRYEDYEDYDYDYESDKEHVEVVVSFDDFEFNGRKWHIDVWADGYVYYEYENDNGDYWTPPSTEIIDAHVSNYDISFDSDDDGWDYKWCFDEDVEKSIIRQYGSVIEDLLLDKFYDR